MDIAGENHHIVDIVIVDVVQDFQPIRRVAIPLIHVDGRQIAAQLRMAFAQRRNLGNIELRKHHLLTNEAPLAVRFTQAIEQKVHLLLTDQVSIFVVTARIGGYGQLLIAAFQPGIQHGQINQVTEGKVAVDHAVIAWLTGPDRQPFEVGLLGNLFAGSPIPFGQRIMIARPVAVAVVGGFVVIPDSNHRELLMHRLQIFVGFILRMALTIIRQGDHFVGRLRIALREITVLAGPVLVQVIAKVQDKIQIRMIGHGPVYGEKSVGIVGAGNHRKTGPVDKRFRCGEGPGPPHRGDLITH